MKHSGDDINEDSDSDTSIEDGSSIVVPLVLVFNQDPTAHLRVTFI